VLHFETQAFGIAELMLGITPSDLSEGFALDPTGFDANVSFQNLVLTIVPEPSTGSLLALGLVGMALGRRWS